MNDADRPIQIQIQIHMPAPPARPSILAALQASAWTVATWRRRRTWRARRDRPDPRDPEQIRADMAQIRRSLSAPEPVFLDEVDGTP